MKSACIQQILIRFLAVADNDSQKDIEERLKVVSICLSSVLENLDGHELHLAPLVKGSIRILHMDMKETKIVGGNEAHV